MKRKLIIILPILLLLSFGGFFLLKSGIFFQNKKIELLEQKIKLLKTETVPLRFKILEKDSGVIKVAIKFYDSDGEVISRIEKKIVGNELSIDFYVFQINNCYVSFPFKIFSDKIAPINGDTLYSQYDKEGFPQIYYQKDIDADLKTGIKDLFEKMKTGDISNDDKYFGNMVHDVKEFKNYETGIIYKVVTHIKGGIEVVEE